MKKTNIAFSGFMAAILLSTGAAHAAAQIASKQYVDSKESSILESVSTTYATTEKVNQIEQNVTSVTEQVTNLGDVINNEETGLAKDVSDLQSSVSGLESSVQGKADKADSLAGYGITDGATKTELTEGLAEKQDKLGYTAEDSANKAASISELNQSSSTEYPSVGAIVEWTNKKISDLSDTGLPVNPDNINDNSIEGSKLVNGAVTTDKIADEAVTEGKLSAELTAKIDGKEDKSNKTNTIDSSSTTEQYPSASAVYTSLQTKADSSALDTVSGKVDALDEAINNEESGLASQITAAKDTADQALAGLADKQDTLTPEQQAAVDSGITSEKVGTYDGYAAEIAKKLDSTTAESTYATKTSMTEELAKKQNALGYTPEDAANKAKTIDEGNKASDALYPTVGAITTWVSSEISDLSELPVNPGLIEDGTLAGSKLQNGAVTTEKIADGAVTTDKLGSDVKASIDGKADASNVYTKGETDSKIVELAVPQPDAACMAESGLCVLSVTPDGDVAWVNVTQPAE